MRYNKKEDKKVQNSDEDVGDNSHVHSNDEILILK